MTRFTLLFVVLATVNYSAVSQNWQTFHSNIVKYYLDSYNNVTGLKFDTVEYVNGDSILYPYKTLRNYEGLSYPPLKVESASIADLVIIKANGDNIYINNIGDSITIKTQANLGDSYVMYTHTDGLTVEATVSEITTAMFYGVLDSVKIFDLTFNCATNFVNPKIAVGKNLGLTTMLPFRSFPWLDTDDIFHNFGFISFEPRTLVGQDNPTLGITRPTYADIYTFNVGDIIQYKNSNFTQLTVIEKNQLPNDSTHYVFLKETQIYDSLSVPSTLSDTLFVSYNTSDNYYSDFMPYEFDSAYFAQNQNCNARINYTDDCGYFQAQWQFDPFLIEYDSINNGYIITQIHYSLAYESVRSNAGDFYVTNIGNGFGLSFIGDYFQYRSHGSNECGNRSYLSTEKLLQPKINTYPNPVSDILFINAPVLIIKTQVYNMNGQIINIELNNNTLDLSPLESGIYFIAIETENGHHYQEKVVKL